MGCCLSSPTSDHTDDPISDKNTTPPPSVVEEKTVLKEVLSESTLVTDNTTSNKIPEDKEKKPRAVNVAPDRGLTENGLVEPEPKGSKICSLSESLLSIVNGCNEEEAKQHGVRERSPAKSRNRVMVHNYPTRRTDMSPRERNAKGGEGGSVRLVPLVTGQRDPTGRSGRRRSRSPVMNRSVMMGPTRVRPDANKNGSDHHQWPSCGAAGGYDVSTHTNSFENPLVTLECFIFL